MWTLNLHHAQKSTQNGLHIKNIRTETETSRSSCDIGLGKGFMDRKPAQATPAKLNGKMPS